MTSLRNYKNKDIIIKMSEEHDGWATIPTVDVLNETKVIKAYQYKMVKVDEPVKEGAITFTHGLSKTVIDMSEENEVILPPSCYANNTTFFDNTERKNIEEMKNIMYSREKIEKSLIESIAKEFMFNEDIKPEMIIEEYGIERYYHMVNYIACNCYSMSLKAMDRIEHTKLVKEYKNGELTMEEIRNRLGDKKLKKIVNEFML